jgi:cysteine desulfurase
MTQIYLDYNASTPLDPGVVRAMHPYLDGAQGNPSSPHWAGRPAREAVERAREQVAAALGAHPDEIVFTSGGSEANNLALKGVYFALRDRGDHIVTSAVEHPAIVGPCQFLERLGATVTYLPVDSTGRVDPDDVRRAIGPRTILVTLMQANNEVGTLQPIAECAHLAREHGVLFHTDAAQAVGKIPTDVRDLQVDLLSVAGHKLYAPKGVGALYVRRGVSLEPLIHGAGHEGGRRAGTESALLAVALGAAAEVARRSLPQATTRLRDLRDRLWGRLQEDLDARIVLNGHPEQRLPNTLNVNFIGWIGADLLAAAPEIAASTGSACHEGQVQLSPVLSAMGVPPELGRGAVRLSVGRFTTEAEVDRAAQVLVTRARASAMR